jgi:sigma-B regulation protein RsbU (phosphoserine phosphatase)
LVHFQTSNQTDEGELVPLLLKRQAELNSLLEVTQAINKNSQACVLFEMLQVILQVHVKIGKMRLLIKEGGHFYCATRFGGLEESAKVLKQTCNILQEIRTITDLKNHPHPLVNIYDYVVPIFHNEDSMAFVVLGDFNSRPELISNDLNFVQTLINIIIVALENKKLFKESVNRELMQRDLELASKVQAMLIPHHLPKTGSVEVGATYLPNQNIGGDYFDFIKIKPGEFMWCIADVSGKGVSAALLMANLQASLRAWASVEDDMAKIVTKLNEIVSSNTKGERFITLFLGRYNEETHELQYVNAGHNAPILICGDEVKFLKEGTTIIGAFDELPFIKTGVEKLSPGSLIFNYTDGLVESDDEDVFISDDELVGYLKKSILLPVDDLNKMILSDIKNNRNAEMNSDDVTILSIRII